MMTPNEGRERGQKRAERGIKAAAYNHKWDISRDQKQTLKMFLADPSRTMTTDDIVENLAKKFGDGGKWRGEVPKGLARLNIIRCVGFKTSCRPSRNGGVIREWALADIQTARQCAFTLELYFLENPDRPVDPKDHNDEFDGTSGVPWGTTAAKTVPPPDEPNEISPLAI